MIGLGRTLRKKPDFSKLSGGVSDFRELPVADRIGGPPEDAPQNHPPLEMVTLELDHHSLLQRTLCRGSYIAAVSDENLR